MKKEFEKAKKFIIEFNKAQEIEISDIRIEEFEETSITKFIAISYLIKNENRLAIIGIIDRPHQRIYKTLFLNKKTGEIEKIKNYNN